MIAPALGEGAVSGRSPPHGPWRGLALFGWSVVAFPLAALIVGAVLQVHCFATLDRQGLAMLVAYESYAIDNARYPDVGDGTAEALRPWLEGTYVDALPGTDAWGHPFRVLVSSDGYSLISHARCGCPDVGPPSEYVAGRTARPPMTSSSVTAPWSGDPEGRAPPRRPPRAAGRASHGLRVGVSRWGRVPEPERRPPQAASPARKSRRAADRGGDGGAPRARPVRHPCAEGALESPGGNTYPDR